MSKVLFVDRLLMGLIITSISLSVSAKETVVHSSPIGADASVSDVQRMIADEGYTEEAKKIAEEIKNLYEVAKDAQKNGDTIQGIAHLKELKSAASYYGLWHGKCVLAQSSASATCREKTSPQLQEILGIVNMMSGMTSMGGSVNNSCSNMEKAMGLVKAGLAAYTAACSTLRATCESTCATTHNNLKRLVDKFPTVVSSATCTPKALETPQSTEELQSPKCIEFRNMIAQLKGRSGEINKFLERDNSLQDEKRMSIALKNKACTYSYAQMLGSAGMGIMSAVNAISQSSDCKKNSDAAKTADNDVCKDPTKANTEACLCKNPSSPECLCFKNPRTSGCSTGLATLNENSNQSFSFDRSSKQPGNSNAKVDGLNGLKNDSDISDRMPSNTGGDSSGAGAPMGGGSAGIGGGGGGGSGAGAGAAGGSAKKGLDANILGGAGGGGGGGSSWGSYGAGGSGTAEKYRAYLPGGAKDPMRNSGQQSWTNEVTGEGGKSNWDKVKERYRDNKSTLINN